MSVCVCVCDVGCDSGMVVAFPLFLFKDKIKQFQEMCSLFVSAKTLKDFVQDLEAAHVFKLLLIYALNKIHSN